MTNEKLTASKKIPPLSNESMPRLIAGTIRCLDIARSRYFYEKFLGFDCVQYAPGKMLIRDQYSKLAMSAGSDDYFVIDVAQVDKITHPQTLFNHWGISVASIEEVDRCHAAAKARQAEFGLKKIQKTTSVHGSYQFYFADADSNWWEIECRIHGLNNERYFKQGDVFFDPDESEQQGGQP